MHEHAFDHSNAFAIDHSNSNTNASTEFPKCVWPCILQVLHTSAKTGLNVGELFQRIAEEGAAARPVRGRASAQNSILDLSGTGSGARSACC